MKFLVLLITTLFIPFALSQASIFEKKYEYASIQYLIEQEVGRIVLPQIYKNVGIDISITPLPGQRAQFEANQGSKDGEIMRIWTYGDENSQTIRVPTPYYYLETVAFTLKDSNVHIREKEELKEYRLAKIRGVKHTNNITKGLSNVYVMNSTENMFKVLLRKKVDVVLTNSLDGELVSKRLGLENVIAVNKPLATLPLYHYINEKNRALVPVINEEILRLKNNGSLQEMILKAEQQVIARGF
ncbi:substrate-binding periplasmic protein [Thalassotalea atypica]|uniref:substrate-binding periplasmic protein n=1 Tax=Thalassotalea atypica TaxID=2054316 RepID=UPI0025732661|nr:transporter substrate-binding domain-containing protein [Thalassotalea atypica]